MMTNMNTADFLRAVDHAAGMNDRWLFVASLVVFGVFAGFVMRYFVQQHERLIADHQQALLEITDTAERLRQEYQLLDHTRRQLAARTVLKDTFQPQ